MTRNNSPQLGDMSNAESDHTKIRQDALNALNHSVDLIRALGDSKTLKVAREYREKLIELMKDSRGSVVDIRDLSKELPPYVTPASKEILTTLMKKYEKNPAAWTTRKTFERILDEHNEDEKLAACIRYIRFALRIRGSWILETTIKKATLTQARLARSMLSEKEILTSEDPVSGLALRFKARRRLEELGVNTIGELYAKKSKELLNSYFHWDDIYTLLKSLRKQTGRGLDEDYLSK